MCAFSKFYFIILFSYTVPFKFPFQSTQITGFSTSGDILPPEAFKLIFYYQCKCVLSNLPTAQ